MTDTTDLIQRIKDLTARFGKGWHDGIQIDASDIADLCLAAAALEQQAAPSVAPEPPDGLCWACGIAINTSQPLPVAPGPVAWMWQHDETGRTGFVGSGFDRAHWEEHNPRLKIIAPCFVHPPRAPLTDFDYDPPGEHPDADLVTDAWVEASAAYAAAIPRYQNGLAEWIVRMRAAIRVLQDRLPQQAHGIGGK